MSKATAPEWVLNANWAIGRDTYNWIQYRKSGRSWRPSGYYPNLELLLQSFHQRLTKTEPAEADLKKHIERCFDEAQAAAQLFIEQISVLGLIHPQVSLPAAHSSFSGDWKRHLTSKGVRHAP